jgi:hypothetical protein
MERPYREVPQDTHAGGIAAATDGSNRGKTVRRSERNGPRAEATHTQAGDIELLWIYVVALLDDIEQRQEGLRRPGFCRGTLRRDHEQGKSGLLLDDFGHAMALHQLQIISSFPRAMEK